MTNFNLLRFEKDFFAFSGVDIAAEHILQINPVAYVLNCRRAMEFAMK